LKLEIPYLNYSDTGRSAQTFLTEYHPSLEIPIPIEKIVDVKMGLDIVPIPNLYRDFDLSGYLTRDRSAIFVDEFQADNYEEKYRYTLAHEIGHYTLHESFYENLPFETSDEYVKWRMSIPPEEMSWFETHGDWFAGQVLLPTNRLEEICSKVAKKYRNIFSKFETIPDDIWSYISNEIARHFEVNPPVAEIRIKKENIPQKVNLGG
jgi:Zn-dependent peptidase ImmA (M78 family)